MKYVFWFLVTALFGVSGQFVGSEALTVVQKGVFSLAVIFGVMSFGVSKSKILPLFILSVAVLLSSIGLLLYEGSEVDLPLIVKSYISFAAVFLCFAIRLPDRYRNYISSAMIFLPFGSVLMGGLLWVGLGLSPWMDEFTGALRLRGASIPPHLAMMAIVGYFFVQSHVVFSKRLSLRDGVLMAGHLLVILLTGTRGAFIVIALSSIPMLRILFKGRRGVVRAILISPVLLAFIALAVLTAMKRSEGTIVEGEQDFSGRVGAWIFFYEKFSESPAFGHGLGAVTDMTKDNEEEYLHAFVVPHNEYLRFMVDIGYVGSIVFFFGLLFAFHRYAKNISIDRCRYNVLWIFVSVSVYSFFDNPIGTLSFSAPFALLLNSSFVVPRRKIS